MYLVVSIMRQNMTQRGRAAERWRHVMNITALHREILSWPAAEEEEEDEDEERAQRKLGVWSFRLNQINTFDHQTLHSDMSLNASRDLID